MSRVISEIDTTRDGVPAKAFLVGVRRERYSESIRLYSTLEKDIPVGAKRGRHSKTLPPWKGEKIDELYCSSCLPIMLRLYLVPEAGSCFTSLTAVVIL